MLDVRHLCLSYGSAWQLNIASLSVEAHGALAVLGPSGAGKSSLLRALALLQPVDSGVIRLNGEIVFEDGSVRQPEDEYRRSVVLVQQEGHLWPNRTAAGNIALVCEHVIGQPRQEALVSAMRWLERFDMPDMADRFPHELSGGQRQRVALARAFALQPGILLLDEPTNGLDNENIVRMKHIIKDHRESGGAIIVASHNPQFVRAISDHWIFLREGVAIHSGSTSDLARQAAPADVVGFLSGLEI